MKQLFTALAVLCTLVTLSAQSYDLAVGVRLGTDLGISTKVRVPPLDENFVMEGILQTSLQREEGTFTLLAEQHIPLITRRVSLYAGIGGHIGWLEGDDLPAEAKAPAGISAIGGAEISFKRLNISYDFKPAVNLVGGEKTFYSQTALTLRYIPFQRHDIFASPRQKRQRARQRERQKRRQDRAARGKKDWWPF